MQTPSPPLPADLSAAIAPLASLASKSEKALQKFAAGSWQHTKLRADLAALSVARVLIEGGTTAANQFAPAQLADALARLAALAAKSEQVQPKFAPGSAQHTLLKNRIAALQAAQDMLRIALPDPGAGAPSLPNGARE